MDLHTTWAKLDAFRPDYLVNCAALVGSINYVTDFAADVVDVNMRIVLNTYKAAQQLSDVVVINPIANCAYPGSDGLYEERGLLGRPDSPVGSLLREHTAHDVGAVEVLRATSTACAP